MIYVVLGMHKSGTTLVSQILHHSGINMMDSVDPSLDYDRGNKWERDSTKAINHELLGSEGEFSLAAVRPKALSVAPELRARMEELVRANGRRYGDWGFKDPRTCLVYDVWASVLPEHRLVVVYRSPQEAWEHYRRTSGKNILQSALFLLRRWCEYNGAIVRYLRQAKMPFVVIQYERFMTQQAEFQRLERFIGRKISDQRRPDLYRSRAGRFTGYPFLRGIHVLLGGESPERIVQQLESHRRSPA